MGLRIRRCACPQPANGGMRCPLPPGAKETAQLALTQLQEAGDDAADDDSIPTAADIAAIGDGSGK